MVYEVFLKKAGKDEFRHAGALEAPDDELAQLLARDTYCRRGEGAEMWLVERSHVLVADAELLAVTADVVHRSNDGAAIAEHRRTQRTGEDA
ncbi:MAG: hypothetical protein AAFP84_13505 [Actinomycetota bacterium]